MFGTKVEMNETQFIPNTVVLQVLGGDLVNLSVA